MVDTLPLLLCFKRNSEEEICSQSVSDASQAGVGKKVKFSHTHYRALGPELIPVYRQSARR